MQRYNKSLNNQAYSDKISAYTLLKINQNQVEMMSKCELLIDDIRYLPLYEDFLQMQELGLKKTHIIARLAEKHHVSESTVKRVIIRFSKWVKL